MRVPGPAISPTSVVLPTATISSPRTATASAEGAASSMVTTSPFR